MTRSRIHILSVCILIGATMPMAAASFPQVRVSVADLDLSHRSGAEEALRRLQAAADEVCGGQPDMRELHRRYTFTRCRAEALSGAVASLHAPLVARLMEDPSYRRDEYLAYGN